MLNEPPERKPSESSRTNSQLTLRIPSVTPTFTIAMLMILATIYLYRLSANPQIDPMLERLGISGALVLGETQAYRLFTSLLLLEQPYAPNAAIGILHTLVALYTLYITGISAERLWGNLRFALVYILGGVAGALVTLVFVPLTLVPADLVMAAAPHAILALVGAEIVYLYKHRKLYAKRGQQRIGFLSGVAAANFILGAFAPRLDLFGLVGGFIAGAILAAFISPFHLPRPHPDEPGALLGEDVNPLRIRLVPLAVYITGLVGLLALAVWLAR